MSDASVVDHDAVTPALPPEQPESPSLTAREVLASDEISPAATLLQDASDWLPDDKPIDLSRYTCPDFAKREVEKMWLKV